MTILATVLALGWITLTVGGSMTPTAGGTVAPAARASLAPSVHEAAAGLRAALRARADGDSQEAGRRFAETARRHPEIADHAGLLESELWLASGDWESAIRAARRALRERPDTPLRPQLHRAEGRAFLEAGNGEAGRAALSQARASTRHLPLRAGIAMELARSYEAAGRIADAADLYRRVWSTAPGEEGAPQAGERLAALEKKAGRSFRSGRDWRRRGDGFLKLARTQEALDAFDQALAMSLSGSDRRRAREKRAQCLFRLRRYPEAVAAFEELAPRDPEARIWLARATARAGDVDGAVEQLERLAQSGPRSLRSRSRYLAALLLEDDHPERAREHFRKLTRGSSEISISARWNLGWVAYRAGRLEEARGHFQALAQAERDPISQLRGEYWFARALEPSDPAAGRRALAELAASYPLSYYGWRAARRVPAYAAPARPRRLEPDTPAALRPAELARPTILVAAGLDEAARDELARLEGRAASRSDRLQLATLYSEAGDHFAAEGLVLRSLSWELARGPVPGHEEAWWLAWPLAWDGLVHRWSAASDGVVEPELVWAIMREESGYRPAVHSTAGAMGLLQIMPTTGERLARDAGLAAFATQDLLLPSVNIRLGAFYLDQLSRRFAGRPSAAIGSYNAGPEAVERWLEERPDLADDEWVEAIPYSQTRRYVKRVLRSKHAYRVLY